MSRPIPPADLLNRLLGSLIAVLTLACAIGFVGHIIVLGAAS